MKELYLSDQDFKNDFSTIELYSYGRSKKLTRYILFELENNLSQGGDRDYELDSVTIEHILPENADEDWTEGLFKKIHQHYIYRLGNYTLLEDHLNRKCGTLSFEQKKPYYHQSQYKLSKTIDYKEWSPLALGKRQEMLAKQAASIWRISYADEKKN